MRPRALSIFLGVSAIALIASGCSTSQGPNDLPLYGNYENVDDQSLCLGMMAFAADFPQAVWPRRSKAFYAAKKEKYGVQSAALYKIAVKKYGKDDAAQRGITGYSSGKSLAYVLGGGAVREALARCQGVADEALAVDAEYQNFLDHLGEAPADPVIPAVVPPAPKVTQPAPQVMTPVPTAEEIVAPANNQPKAQFIPTMEVEPTVGDQTSIEEPEVRRISPESVPEGMKILSTPKGDFLISDPEAKKETGVLDINEDTPANDLNAMSKNGAFRKD